MSDTLNDYFAQRYAAATSEDQSSYLDSSSRLLEKREQLAEATRNKLKALNDAHTAYKNSQTLTGKIASLGTDNPNVRQFSEGVVSGTGLALDGLGLIVGKENVNGDYLKEVAANIRSGQDTTYAAEMRNSAPQGDITDPSTWTMGDDPTLRGFMANVTNVFGQMAPVIAGSLVTGGMAGGATAASVAGGAVVGGLQGAGSGAEDAQHYMDSLSDQDLFAQVPLFKTIYDQAPGTPEEKAAQARQAVTDEAIKTQALVGGLIAGIGGGITGKLVQPFKGALGKGISGRVAGAGLTSAEEGTQEVLESALGRAAVNASLGTNRNTTEDTFADAVLGSAAGGGTTAVREAVSLTTGQTKKEIEFEKFEKSNAALDEARKAGDVTQALRNKDVSVEDVVKTVIANYRNEASGKSKPVEEAATAEGETPTTPKAKPASALDEVKQVREALLNQQREVEVAVATFKSNDTVDTLKEKITDYQDLIAHNKSKNKTDSLPLLESQLENAKLALNLLETKKYSSIEDVVAKNKNLGNTKPLLDRLNEILDVEDSKVKETTAPKVQEAVSKALDTNTPEPEKAKAVDDAVILLMESPESATVEEIEGLMASPTLTPTQKKWLRTLSEATIARNELSTMNDVNVEILTRSERTSFKSLPDHERDIRAAFKSGNVELINKNLGNLTQFYTAQASKAEAINKAFAAAKPDGIQVVPAKENGQLRWTTLSGKNKLSEKELKAAAGYKIHPGSNKTGFIDLVNRESAAVFKTLNMLKTEYALRNERAGKPVEAPVEAPVDTPSVDTPVASKPQEQAPAKAETKPKAEQGDPSPTPPPIDETTVAEEFTDTEYVAETPVEPEPVSEPKTETVETVEQPEVVAETPGEETAAVTEETVAEEVTEEEEVLEETSERVEGYVSGPDRYTMNVFKAYFAKKKGHVSNLTNYISQFVNTPLEMARVKELISPNKEIRTKQLRAIESVGKFINAHVRKIQNITEARDAKFNYNSVTQHLFEDVPVNKNGTKVVEQRLGKETAAAIAVAIHEVLIAKATTPTNNSPEKVQKAYGTPGVELNLGHPLYTETMNNLLYGGTVRNTFIEELGKAALDVMGSKAHKDAPKQLQENLINELGTYALQYLKSQNLIQETAVKKTSMAAIGLGNSSEASNQELLMYKPLRGFDNETGEQNILEPRVQAIVEASRGSKAIVSRTFDVANTRTWPLEAPPEKVPSKVKDSIMDVPRELGKRIEKAQKFASYLLDDMTGPKGLFRVLPREVLGAIAGITSEKNLIKSKFDSVIGKNLGINSDLDNLYEFMDSWETDKPIYWEREVWAVHRIGLVSNVFNPLQSKIHRFAVKNEGADYAVPTSQRGAAYKEFRLAILEGLGIKVDKMEPEKSLKEWAPTIKKNPVIAAGIEELVKVAKGQTDINHAAIIAASAEGKEAVHSLTALWQYAQYLNAKDLGEKSFTATLTREADGVNNGPFSAFIQSGVLNLDQYEGWGNKGGLFTEQDLTDNSEIDFNTWAGNKQNRDLYQTLAEATDAALKNSSKPLSGFWLTTIKELVNDKGMVTSSARKIFKGPITEAVFGASAKRATKALATSALENWIDMIQENYALYMTDPKNNKEALTKLGELIKEFQENIFEKGKGVPPFISPSGKLKVSELANLDISPRAVKAFYDTFDKQVGHIAEEVLTETLNPFFEVRGAVHEVANVVGEVLNEMLVVRRDAALNELVQSKAINTKGKSVHTPLDDLTNSGYRKLFSELTKFAPYIASALSNPGKVITGLLATPLGRGRASISTPVKPNTYGLSPQKAKKAEDAYEEAVRKASMAGAQYSQYLGTVALNEKAVGQKTAEYTGNKLEFESAGARAFVTNAHGIDSATATQVYQDHNILNVHDAAIAAPHVLTEVMKKYNSAYFDIMIDHSIPVETLVTLARVRENLSEYMSLYGPTPKLTELFNKLGTVAAKTYPVLARAETNKLEYLSKVGRVHQYAYSGSHHDVTAEQKARIEALKAASIEERVKKRLKQQGIVPPSLDYLKPVNALLDLSADVQSKLQETKSAESKSNLQKYLEVLAVMRKYYVRTGNLSKAIAHIEERFKAPEYEEVLKDVIKRSNKRIASYSGKVNTAYDIEPALLEKVMEAALANKEVPPYLMEDFKKFLEAKKPDRDSYVVYDEYVLRDIIKQATGNYPVPLTELLNRLVANTNIPLVSGKLNPEVVTKAQTANSYDLVTELRKKETHTLAELKNIVASSINGMPAGRTKNLRAAIYKNLFDALPADTKIVYITAATPKAAIPLTDISNIHGFYDSGEKYIGLIDPELSGKPLDSETVVHELLHAATFYALRYPSSAAAHIIKNLEGLLNKVKAEASKGTEAQTFAKALGSLDEFISWGLTNQKFQEYLTTIELDPTTEIGNTKQFQDGETTELLEPFQKIITNGLKEFTKYITALIFGTDKAKGDRLTAMEALIVNGAGLIEAARVQGFGLNKNAGFQILTMDGNPTGFTEMSSEQTLETLAQNESIGHFKTEELKKVLDEVITSVHGPLGNLIDTLRGQGKANPAEAFQQAILSGEMPLYNSVAAKGIALDKASLYVTEQVDLAVRTALDTSSLATKELKHLFDEAKAKLSPKDFVTGDWNTATPTDRERAKRIYGAIFSFADNGVERRSGLLAQFAALSMTYEPLKSALNYSPVTKEVPASQRLGDRIKAWFHNAMRSLASYLYTNNQLGTAQERIKALATSMVRREQLQQQKLAEQATPLDKTLEHIEQLAHSAGTKAIDAAKTSKYRPVKLAGKLGGLYRDGKMDELAETFEYFRKVKLDDRMSFLGKLLTEARGDSPHLRFAIDLINSAKVLQKDRQHEIANISSDIKEIIGETSPEEESALTRGLIRTDVASLLGHLPIPRILQVIKDASTLDTEIRMHEQSLASIVGNDTFYKHSAYVLGHYLATDEVKSPLLSMNAYNIAHKFGTGETVPMELAHKAEPVIDRLATLYALKRLPAYKKIPLQNYLHQQNNSEQVLNGLLQIHKGMVNSSKESLFAGQATKMQKGYIKELYDPFVSVEVAPLSVKQEMANHGYEVVSALSDAEGTHPEPLAIYRSDTGGLATYNSAAFSKTGTRSKGSTADISKKDGSWGVLVQRIQKKDLAMLRSPDFTAKFNSLESGRLAPVYRTDGSISKYRYLMDATTKDSLLSRNTQITKVMGAIAGSIIDKPGSVTQNDEVVRSLLDNWKENRDSKAEMYVKIGVNATSPELREKYASLPDATKKAIKRVWGDDNFYVRSDALDMIFGYRDFKLSDVLKKDETIRNASEQVAAKLFSSILGDNAVHKLDRFQDSWETIVSKVKNIYVIRNLNTLLGNEMSNNTLLWGFGVPVKDIVKNKLIAADALITYQKESRELFSLQLKLSKGLILGSTKDVEDRIAELESNIKNSPIHNLMEAGQFPSILEDLDEDNTAYDFKPFLEKKLDEYTAKLPEEVLTVGKTLMVSEGTPIYKLLYKATQMSDFIAKFALYKHLMANGVTEEEAQREIREAFINYDVPSGRIMHFMNKTGLLMFTRYFIRIQKVLAKMFSEHAVRSLMLVLADRFLGGIPSVNDSWILNRIGNPLDAGALEAFDAWDEPIVMKSMLSIFD